MPCRQLSRSRSLLAAKSAVHPTPRSLAKGLLRSGERGTTRRTPHTDLPRHLVAVEAVSDQRTHGNAGNREIVFREIDLNRSVLRIRALRPQFKPSAP